jgi:hypothetical protein
MQQTTPKMKHLVTIFKSVKDVQVGYNKAVEYALKRIKEGAQKGIIERIRTTNPELKNTLPVVCFNGQFKRRSDSGLVQHSGLIVLDFDKIPEAELLTIRAWLISVEYTFALFTSPSGKGFKVLFRIPPEPENHKLYFDAITEFLSCPYLDASGKDLSRACFESYDPDLYYNPDSTVWVDKAVESVEDIGVEVATLPIVSENRIIDNILTWWNKKYGATKGDRNNNVFKLAIALNDFGINKSEAENVLMKFREKDFTEGEIMTIVKSAYKRSHQFGTKFFEDSATTARITKQIRSGKKDKDIVSEFSELPREQVQQSIDSIKKNLSVDEFWEITDNGKIKMVPHKFKFWLQQNDFFKYYPTKSNTYTFIKKDQNLLEETGDRRIKDFVLDSLLKRSDVGYAPYDFMANNSKYFHPDFLSILETANVEVKEDTQSECFIYFKNTIVKVTADNIQEIDYVDSDGFIWKRQIIDREFIKCDHHPSEFRTFLWKIAGEDRDRYNSMKSVIGYLLHSYKTSAKNRAIIFNDEVISEDPNGGSGKGVVCNAISFMKRSAFIDGKTFEFTKSFPYQTVSTDTQVLVFDDVKKNFNFESLFSLITEGITLEYKGQDAIKLPVQQSPKVVITTNYTIGGTGGSFERRKFEIELSGYFNASHSPLDEFGHMLFDDWNLDEWNRFYSFMLECTQYFLKNGLCKYDHKNLATRKFIKATSHEFYEWAKEGNIPVNTQINLKSIYNDFILEHGDFKKFLHQRRFTTWIKSYGKQNKLREVAGKTNGERWLMLADDNAPKINIEDDLPF